MGDGGERKGRDEGRGERVLTSIGREKGRLLFLGACAKARKEGEVGSVTQCYIYRMVCFFLMIKRGILIWKNGKHVGKKDGFYHFCSCKLDECCSVGYCQKEYIELRIFCSIMKQQVPQA